MSGNSHEPSGQEPTDISLEDFCKALGTTSGSETKFREVLKQSPGWHGLVSNRDNWETIAKALPLLTPSEPFVEMAMISQEGTDLGILCVSMGCRFISSAGRFNVAYWLIQNLSARQVEDWIAKGPLNDRAKATVIEWVKEQWKRKGKDQEDASGVLRSLSAFSPRDVWPILSQPLGGLDAEFWAILPTENKRDIIQYVIQGLFERWGREAVRQQYIYLSFAMHFQNDPEFRKDVKDWAKKESKQPEEYYLSGKGHFCDHSHPAISDFDHEFLYIAGMKASSLLLPSTYCIPELKLELSKEQKNFREMLEKSGDPLLRDFDREVEDVRRRLSPLTHRTVWARRGANVSEKISKKIKEWFKQKQHLLNPKAKLPKWPKLTVSDDDPPAFRENPWMKKLYDEDQVDFPFDGTPDTESLLGVYLWKTKEIIIWRKGVEFCARAQYRLNGGEVKALYEDIYTCVLVHEMGHWFNAEAITPDNVPWNTAELEISTGTKIQEPPCNPDHNIPGATVTYPLAGNARSLSSRSYHEAWAQWFAWLYGQEVDAAAGVAMAVLNPRQSEPYHAWKKLVNANPSMQPKQEYSLRDLDARWPMHKPHVQQRILQSLKWSRQLTDSAGNPVPATFDDKNYPERNMLGWL